MPGMTAREATQAQVAPTQHAVHLYGLDGILGAARIKPAMRTEQRTDQVLVGADESDEEATHVCFRMVFQA